MKINRYDSHFVLSVCILFISILSGCDNPDAAIANSNNTTHSTEFVSAQQNLPPIVNAGEKQLVEASSSVSLNGRASDADGQINNYLWTQTQGPKVEIQNANSLNASFIAPENTELVILVFNLEATDNSGASRSSDVTIAVNGRPELKTFSTILPRAHFQVNAGADQLVEANQTVTLSGSFSAQNTPVNIASQHWVQVSGPEVTIDLPNEMTSTFTAPQVVETTSLTFELSAIDTTGETSTDTIQVVVIPSNLPPTVSAGPDQIVIQSNDVTLVANANDPDGTITRYSWQQTLGFGVQLSNADQAATNFTAPATDVPLTLVFNVSVVDNNGILRSDDVRIVVYNDANTTLPGANIAPVVGAGSDLIVESDTIVTLQGTAHDPDGTIQSIQWTQLPGGTQVILDPADQLQTQFVAPNVSATETLTFVLIATDDQSASNSSHVNITVNPATNNVANGLGAGFRFSTYGPPSNPGPNYWANVGQQLASRFNGATPQAIWIVGSLANNGNGTRLSFPGTSTDQNILFSNIDENEAVLTLFDQLGIEVWLQVEPGNASIPELIQLTMNQYAHHPSVIGFGVDVEWYQINQFREGKAVTDQEANTWLNAIRSFDVNYRLFLKHWLTQKMPINAREGLFFVNDSQQFNSVNEMLNEFTIWGETFATAEVGYQFGYDSDKIWWNSMTDPMAEIGNQLLANIPNTKGLYWVDFTIFDLFPPF